MQTAVQPVSAFEPHEPLIILLSTTCTYACLIFFLWTKFPDGYRWHWIWGLLWGELDLRSTSRPNLVALETPWSCFRFIFHLSRLWVCLFMYWTKVRYCNKALSLIFFLYNLFYMFHTYGLPPILLFKIWAWHWYLSWLGELRIHGMD
jgi:hypothetical protein